ncbi:hypothetical protein FHX74_000263 [Friedmanniella endophytica]|uniref:Uncharacterized protein n=1 Tax=Microlunatus kandeliicorticis TaxID=1759536 RepID=A0A7W3IP52_9ACTN|nr:hypothetical protein [Microlunatus kandeliicorticis]MBA8792669.1 hypothetical protein [Microlunatus kandeliicorticis]
MSIATGDFVGTALGDTVLVTLPGVGGATGVLAGVPVAPLPEDPVAGGGVTLVGAEVGDPLPLVGLVGVGVPPASGVLPLQPASRTPTATSPTDQAVSRRGNSGR